MIDMRSRFDGLKRDILCSPLNYIFASFRNIERSYQINFFKNPQTRGILTLEAFLISFNPEFISVLYSLYNLIYIQTNQNQKIASYILPSTDGYTMRNNSSSCLMTFLRSPAMNRNHFRAMAKKDFNEYFSANSSGDIETNFFILQIIFLLLSDNAHQVYYHTYFYLNLYFKNLLITLVNSMSTRNRIYLTTI